MLLDNYSEEGRLSLVTFKEGTCLCFPFLYFSDKPLEFRTCICPSAQLRLGSWNLAKVRDKSQKLLELSLTQLHGRGVNANSWLSLAGDERDCVLGDTDTWTSRAVGMQLFSSHFIFFVLSFVIISVSYWVGTLHFINFVPLCI